MRYVFYNWLSWNVNIYFDILASQKRNDEPELTIYLFDIEYKISSYLVAIFISLNDSKV